MFLTHKDLKLCRHCACKYFREQADGFFGATPQEASPAIPEAHDDPE